jgi:glycosyltransferase involved in cell wall biosynthesis
MRIGLDGMPLAQARTGVGVYTFELARALAAAAPGDNFELISPRRFEPDLHEENKPDNLALVYSRPNVLQRHWWTIGLPSYIRRHPVQLFHGTNYEVPLRQYCPTVVTIHDLSQLLHSSMHEARAARRARLLLPLMARKATLVITPSETVRREVIEHLKLKPEKVFAIPLAARSCFRPMPFTEADRVRNMLEIEEEFLLFVGTIEPRKNLVTLIRALEEVLRATDLRAQLVIAGRIGWKNEETMVLVKSTPARDRIRLIGFPADRELRALYSLCRAFVYPSVYEGFGLPPLEAMACGAPVIVSLVPSVTEGGETAARLIEPTDVHDLARGIVELLSDEERRQAFARAGLKHAANFSWERTATMTREVYGMACKKLSTAYTD